MAFYLSKEREADVAGAYRRYREYLEEHREQFPPNAFALGTAEWYQNPSDHRCPHDAWLEKLCVAEIPTKDRHRDRYTTIHIRLLGAYHDGHIELVYPQVFEYELESRYSQALGDWRYDEFRLSSNGQLIHEIEWAETHPKQETPRWIITASDVEFRWIPDVPTEI